MLPVGIGAPVWGTSGVTADPAAPIHPDGNNSTPRASGAVLTDLGPDGPNLIAWLGLIR